jgi:hypothetical protein
MPADHNVAMAGARSSIAKHGNAAMAELDSMLPGGPQTSAKMVEVMHHFIAMRDDLIAAQRAGAPCGEELQRINGVLSSIFGVEFPSEGLQWQRVCDTREALRRLASEAGRGRESASTA